MSYIEEKTSIGTLIRVTCEARKGKGVCGSTAEAETPTHQMSSRVLYNLGWRLLRGKQVCGSCMLRYPRVSFPRKKVGAA